MEDFIVTRGIKNKTEALNNFMAVTYEAPKKKQKANNPSPIIGIKGKSNDDNNQIDPKRKQELEMKKARFEVMKFGMTGFTKTKAREAKVALAISLGAKPQKNKKKNYKQILNEKKIQKTKEERRKTYSGVTQSLKKRKTRRKNKKESGILGVYGKVQTK